MFEDIASELWCCPNLNVAPPFRAAIAGLKTLRKKSSSAVILRSSSGPEHREGRISHGLENTQTEILPAVHDAAGLRALLYHVSADTATIDRGYDRPVRKKTCYQENE
jgi:hypothetical protein